MYVALKVNMGINHDPCLFFSMRGGPLLYSLIFSVSLINLRSRRDISCALIYSYVVAPDAIFHKTLCMLLKFGRKSDRMVKFGHRQIDCWNQWK